MTVRRAEVDLAVAIGLMAAGGNGNAFSDCPSMPVQKLNETNRRSIQVHFKNVYISTSVCDYAIPLTSRSQLVDGMRNHLAPIWPAQSKGNWSLLFL